MERERLTGAEFLDEWGRWSQPRPDLVAPAWTDAYLGVPNIWMRAGIESDRWVRGYAPQNEGWEEDEMTLQRAINDSIDFRANAAALLDDLEPLSMRWLADGSLVDSGATAPMVDRRLGELVLMLDDPATNAESRLLLDQIARELIGERRLALLLEEVRRLGSRSQTLVRPERLDQAEIVRYVDSFERAEQRIVEAGQDGLIDPDHFESVQNILEQIRLVRLRPSAKTQQLELLIVELIEILNGSIEDEARFRDAFVDAGASVEDAAVAAHEMMRGIEAAARLGGDDPVEAGAALAEVGAADEKLRETEARLRDEFKKAAAKGAGTAVGVGGVGATGAFLREPFTRIARELIGGFGRIFTWWHGLNN